MNLPNPSLISVMQEYISNLASHLSEYVRRGAHSLYVMLCTIMGSYRED